MNRVVLMLFLAGSLFADGEKIFREKCAFCHADYIPVGVLKENFVEFNNTKLKLKGPTINQLSFRLKQKIGDPSGDEEFHEMEVSEFIKAYVIAPDRQKSVCMDEVMAAFDTMPSMKGKISEAELEEVSQYIYDYDKKMLEEHMPVYVDFKDAVEKAKRENKVIMIKATSEHCHFCKKMDREVLSENDVLSILKKEFVSVAIDVYQSQLPLGLTYKVTPTYFFVTADEKVIKTVPGSWDKEDFIDILKEVERLKKGAKK